jgi:hypothetical protein
MEEAYHYTGSDYQESESEVPLTPKKIEKFGTVEVT